MHTTLAPAQFFGHEVSRRVLGRFTLAVTRYDAGMTIPLHEHRDAYVTFVLQGRYRERSSGASREYDRRDAVIHAPAERHEDVFPFGAATCLNIHGASFDRSVHVRSTMTSMIPMRLQQELREPDALSSMVVEALMLELFVAGARESTAARAPRWLTEARSLVEARFRQPLALSDIAAAVEVHATHVARAFRTHYGTTVGELIRHLRVDYAKERLASPAPLKEIALDAGFADQSHLTRTFRRVTGFTPAMYRRSLR